MQCLEASELISLRLDQPLAAEQERVLQAHLANCQTCRTEWQMVQRVHTLFDGVSRALPPLQMKERVMASVQLRDGRLAAWKKGFLISVGLIMALALGAAFCLGISALVAALLSGPLFIQPLIETVARLVAIVTTVMEALIICLRALLASPTWLVVVGYLLLAGALLVGWTRLVVRPYRSVDGQREPQ